MTEEQMSEEQVRKANLIRLLCRGRGLDDPASNLRQIAADLGYEDPAVLSEVLRKAIGFIAYRKYRYAIEAALGVGDIQADTLTERRLKALELRPMAERTLIRHEIRGANQLAILLENGAESILSQPEEQKTAQSELAASIRELAIEIRNFRQALSSISHSNFTTPPEGT